MRRWRFQFGLRTLLIAVSVLPPSIAAYWRWREDHLWFALDAAKQRRDDSLVAWRKTYDAFTNGKADLAQEAAAQERYFAARLDAESALRAIYDRYGNSEHETLRAMRRLQARHHRK